MFCYNYFIANFVITEGSLKFSNTYYQLGEAFYQIDKPTPVISPQLILWNSQLAESLAIELSSENDATALAKIFSGNDILDGSQPIALAYSGHQFGHFNPYLGDGRAHLLGEVLTKHKQRVDIQLKGSGQTAYSRQGDGRCALGPAIREYIMSEAMDALGVPTSRCLAVVTTGEPVYRETAQQGAVVTRVASSHIRVGTFQYFAARQNLQSLRDLTHYTIARHFPEIGTTGEKQILDFLNAVIDKQIKLIVAWLRVGFIHGVMNTDNTAICGETIDFGPCAMMGIYHPGTVFSSIDRHGRYAYANQSRIAQWNMARFAECLLLLLQDDKPEGIEQEQHEQAMVTKIEQTIADFNDKFARAYQQMMAKKLGFIANSSIKEADKVDRVKQLLTVMEEQQLDYTETFNQLTQSLSDENVVSGFNVELRHWYKNWHTLLTNSDLELARVQQLMCQNNPVVIPRNHHVERILKECEEHQDFAELHKFIAVLRSPYEVLANTKYYQDLPADGDKGYRTFCGT